MQKQRLNPYQVLGVEPSADDETIKKAYRRKAKALHPDAGGDADRFAEATLAYDVLMDAKRRKLFDETGKIDSQSEDNKEQAARQVLFDMLAHALMGDVNPLAVNLVHQMDQNLQKQIAEVEKRQTALRRATERAQALEKRFVRKSKKAPEPNLFTDMLKRHQDQIAQAIEHNERQLETLTRALDILRLYGFDAVQRQTATHYAATGFGFTPFGGGTL